MTLSLPPVSAARIHSHLLGGEYAFPLDHAVACHATKAAPWWPSAVQGMHRYGERMVAHLAARGLDQVLDLGSGLPSPRGRQIHQIAAAFNQGPRGARTVYVDHDPHTHIRRCIDLTDQHGATSILADITDTGALFEHPELQVLNLRRPVAVLLHDVLPWLPDEEAAHLLTELRRRLAPGSFISATHLIPSPPPYATTPLVRCYLEAGIRLWPRTLTAISSWSGTWPAYTHGPHTGAGPVPVCALLLRAPGPLPFTRPPFWSSPQHASPRRTP